eukprot:TRINITY_DN25968_c0_g1_i2.p1 TRINITY_DN25968_c0_g1~~TRINITY_DN25968_c0_g1_i2.p1  ORF type:complete len:168 (-),score=45.11 TRINITY_DN25968_c0_g1_i2:122-625(-)
MCIRDRSTWEAAKKQPSKAKAEKGAKGRNSVRKEVEKKMKWKIEKAETLVDHAKLEQAVEEVSKTFVESDEPYKPIGAEEIIWRVKEYKSMLKNELDLSSLKFKALELPKGTVTEPSLDLIMDEQPISKWLDKRMDVIGGIVANRDDQVYSQDIRILYAMEFCLAFN